MKSYKLTVIIHCDISCNFSHNKYTMYQLQILFLLYMFNTCLTYTFVNRAASYIQYEHWDASDTGVVKFKFKTYNHYGLLLYSDNSKSSNSVESFIVVKLNSGKLSLTVQMGAEDYKSKKSGQIGKNLHDLKWHHVEIHRTGRETKLVLDKDDEVMLINDGEHDKLELNSGVFFGGISKQMAADVVDKRVRALPRFIGCIEDIRFKSGSADAFGKNKIEASDGVQNGCLDACKNKVCPNQGKCVNRFTTAKCNCIGTGYHGKNCTQESDSLHFKGKEYVSISVAGPLTSTFQNDIKLRFKTTHPDGVIFAAKSGKDHFMIELHSTTIRLSMNLGGGVYTMKVNNIDFSDGDWHLIEFLRKGRQLDLIVDRKYTTKANTPGAFRKFDLRDVLYMGGHPKVETLNTVNSKSLKNFNGCLQHVFYNGLDIVYKATRTKSNRFKLFGKVKIGCPVKKLKNKNTRGNPDPAVSISGPIDPNNNPKNTNIPVVANSEKMSRDNSTLSKKTVIWIAVGLIVGFIVLIVTLAIIVHNVRNRYSGVFLSSNYKESNGFSRKKRISETVIYTPRNGHPKIEPHIL
ncbi:neurexin-3-like isoform X2 [Hydractinia symbiolongicarpus]|uniref:neurexin-3-like isoform X2 n=1 Tax=Hydractinia symbiolongicarpus TaxID=13093 RepID=UPI00254DE229|nr:neurexin-3-like isoform X2 [Hydractinia symbiolongicarpus]